jgi:diguanylate cyclase (GGDEF)-like protein
MTYTSRYISVEDVFVRVIIVALLVSIAAGLTIQVLSHSSVAEKPLEIALYAYLIGSIGGFLIAGPLVHTFMIAQLKRKVTFDVDQILREDRLTGLLNRQEFFGQISRQGNDKRADVIESSVQGSQSCFFTGGVLLIADIDGLQTINDRFGDAMGDTVIALISGAIQKSVRDIDFVSRISGDEFGIFLPAIDEDKGLEVADRIRGAVCDIQLIAHDRLLPLNVSLGATIVSRSTPLATALKEADRALTDAKLKGANGANRHEINLAVAQDRVSSAA